jgi:hypothetical protein
LTVAGLDEGAENDLFGSFSNGQRWKARGLLKSGFDAIMCLK